MKRCLVDVNVALALLVRQHEHHERVRKWFEALNAGEVGLCRLVQLALVRLLGNRSILADHAISAVAAWRLTNELLEDERIDFLAEPPLLDAVLPTLLSYPIPSGKLINDAYLAAFSMAAARRLVTLDCGFRQFRGLEVDLLSR